MNNDDLTALANELLVCYWDKSPVEELARITAKYGTEIGSKVFHKAVDRVESILSGSGYHFLNEENHSRLLTKSIQAICQETGAELGRDISLVDGGVLIDNAIFQPFLDDLPPGQLEEMKAKGHIKEPVTQDPFKMLETSLGLPFFDSLEAIAKLRAATLDDASAAAYMGMLVDGMINKHSWLSPSWAYSFSERVLGTERLAVIRDNSGTIQGIENTSAHVFGDLLTALGGNVYDHPEHGPLLGRDALLLLDKVFRGEERSLAELAEIARRASR
jgi:hypothetical protein